MVADPIGEVAVGNAAPVVDAARVLGYTVVIQRYDKQEDADEQRK